jgi:hypothetical protein
MLTKAVATVFYAVWPPRYSNLITTLNPARLKGFKNGRRSGQISLLYRGNMTTEYLPLLTLAGKFVQNRQPTWVQMRYQSEVIRLMQ